MPVWIASMLLAVVLQAPASSSPAPVRIELPGGSGGIGFDDLQFSTSLNRVLVPGGRTGALFLVDPETHAVSSIGGFSRSGGFHGGHGEGITSVGEAEGRLFVTDRTSRALLVVDPASGRVTARAGLAAGPDYVRYVPATGEVWVTEPDRGQIEVFALPKGAPPRRERLIAVPNGPESLVVDDTRGRAYTHLWEATTLAIDVARKEIVAHWKNRCEGSRGMALDEPRGLLFAGCDEGRAVVLDAARDGKVLGDLRTGARGVDIIDYDRTLHHLYLPGGASATMAVVAVQADGSLAELGTLRSPAGGHCVASDQRGRAYVCDPKSGRLAVIRDPFPAMSWR